MKKTEKINDNNQEKANRAVKVDIFVDKEFGGQDVHDETSSIVFAMLGKKKGAVKSGIVGAFSVATLISLYLALKDLEKELLHELSKELPMVSMMMKLTGSVGDSILKDILREAK